MARLTKKAAKLHAQACDLLTKDVLSDEDKDFVLTHWQESANHVNGPAGAFFTPPGLASDFRLDAGYAGSMIDLCAGIGALSLPMWQRDDFDRRWNNSDRDPMRIVCVENNPDYVAVGKKILPEATWICADVFDLPADLLDDVRGEVGTFEVAIGNPPFGTATRDAAAPRYRGREFEYHVIDIAADLADRGAFIIPQASAPFVYSGRRCYDDHNPPAKYTRFHDQTGHTLDAGLGIDTSIYAEEWHFTAPTVEVVTVDYRESTEPTAGPAAAAAGQPALFA